MQTQSTAAPRLLKVQEVADVLGLPARILRGWAHQGRVSHVRVGQQVRFTSAHVEELRDYVPRSHHRPWSATVALPAGPGVYFVAAGGLVKIGLVIRTSIGARMTTLQCGSPLPLVLHRFVTTTRPERLEVALHRCFASLRSHGEWFDAATLREIDALTDEELIGFARRKAAASNRRQIVAIASSSGATQPHRKRPDAP